MITVRATRFVCGRLLLPVMVTAAISINSVLPAAAVIGGQPDGTAHPYAGAVDARPLGGRNPIASGVLISPTVFLTAAHFTTHLDDAGLTQARVTFDPIVSDSSTWYTGTIHTNPAYDPSITALSNRGDAGDLAVIVFHSPVPGVTPASLPTEDFLDSQRAGTHFDLAAYGVSKYVGGSNGGGPRSPDFSSTGTRTQAHPTFASLSPGSLRLRMEAGAEACSGDSGSASLLAGSDLVVGITSVQWSLSGGQCESGPWDQRVDTPSARAFLDQYVTLP
jgi:hypothetical protein